MTDTHAALIVSHGQPSEPEVAEAELSQFAARVARHLPGWHVGAATLAQPGALDAALADAGPAPVVYPLFMTEGWFTGENLRNRLAGAPQARVLRPLGVSPDLPALAADLIANRDRAGGMGEGRDPPLPRRARLGPQPQPGARHPRLCRRARRSHRARGNPRGFRRRAALPRRGGHRAGRQSLCLPFFAAARGHVLDDIPEGLDAGGFSGRRLAPLGLAPAVPALIARAIAGDR